MAKKSTAEKSAEQMIGRDELADFLQETINAQFKKKETVAFFLDGNGEEAATEVKEWVPTGASTLDLCISNRPHGGLPVGKIIEIMGLEASGKSLVATHCIAETQKKGGIGIYIDTESAMSPDFVTAIGVDTKKMLYVQLEALEDIFETMETMILKIRESEKTKLVTIVVDSIMGASTRAELDGNYDKEGWATDKAIIISKAMRKITNLISKERVLLIFTNQLRDKLGATFGDKFCVDPYTTKVKIRYKYIYEEITLAELSERFLLNNDFKTPEIYEMDDQELEVLTLDSNGIEIYKPILNFIVKEEVDEHFTDGLIKVSGDHKFIENNKIIFAKEHPDFKKIDEPLDIVDIEVADEHSFLANGRLNHNTTSGGKALGFHASVRLRMQAAGQIKAKDVNGIEQTIGITTKVKVIKNRVGPPLRTAVFDIYFDRGIDDFGSWLEIMKNLGIATLGGAWYTYVSDDGEILKFQSKEFMSKVLSNDHLKEEIYNKICNSMIMKYKSGELGIDDVQKTDEPIEE